MYLQNALSLIALVISCVALTFSVLAHRKATKVAVLSTRHDAIKHVRNAISDVTLHANIRAETIASIRDAIQLSSLVFSSVVKSALEQALSIAFRLQHKSLEQQTDKDFDDHDLLAKELDSVLKTMIKEAQLG
jgi:hypothetical protein